MNASITWVFFRSEKGRHSYAPDGHLMRYCQFSKRQWDFLKKPRKLSQPAMTIRSFVGIAVCGFCKAGLVPNGVRKWKSLTPAKARRFNSLSLRLHDLKVRKAGLPPLFVSPSYHNFSNPTLS